MYSMVECLLRLKMYLIILEDEGVLEGNLTEQQWKIITNLKTLLQPFMIAQRLLEGESYVTITRFPFMLYKIRKDLKRAANNEQSSPHVVAIGRSMLEKFNEIFGTGKEGSVAYNVFDDGRHPRCIPRLTLMASLLDPRMEAGFGILPVDKEQIWCMIKDEAIRTATDNLPPLVEQQQQCFVSCAYQQHQPLQKEFFLQLGLPLLRIGQGWLLKQLMN
jgi:hypothetical protein